MGPKRSHSSCGNLPAFLLVAALARGESNRRAPPAERLLGWILLAAGRR